jgi:hypothetical protein
VPEKNEEIVQTLIWKSKKEERGAERRKYTNLNAYDNRWRILIGMSGLLGGTQYCVPEEVGNFMNISVTVSF